jgi:hypothetical protein
LWTLSGRKIWHYRQVVLVAIAARWRIGVSVIRHVTTIVEKWRIAFR